MPDEPLNRYTHGLDAAPADAGPAPADGGVPAAARRKAAPADRGA